MLESVKTTSEFEVGIFNSRKIQQVGNHTCPRAE